MGHTFLLEIFFISIFIHNSFVNGGEFCLTDDGTDTVYCDNGCCGDDPNDQYCCLPITWIIVGSILGAVFIISIVTVFICIFCKMKGKQGRVIQPQSGVSTVTYATQTNINHGYHGTNYGGNFGGHVQPTAPPAPPPYGFNPQPPPYSQPYGQPPPQYGQYNQFSTQPTNTGNTTDSAYPPPPSQYT